jgi:DnaJ-class molecular chaperone
MKTASYLTNEKRKICRGLYRFFGGGFGGFGFGEQQEEEAPKGDTVFVELEVSLKDLYVGRHLTVVRDKNVIKPASGTRKCNCKQKVVTQQLGPGMFQQYTTKVGLKCHRWTWFSAYGDSTGEQYQQFTCLPSL